MGRERYRGRREDKKEKEEKRQGWEGGRERDVEKKDATLNIEPPGGATVCSRARVRLSGMLLNATPRLLLEPLRRPGQSE